MTRDEATERCAALTADSDGERHWFLRPSAPDVWQVVSVAGTELSSRGALKEPVESRPRPTQPPDPRPGIIQNIPPSGPA